MGEREEVDEALARFHRAFASGDPDALTELFATDGRLLLVHREALEGHAAIRAHWARLFGAYDASAWHAEPLIVDVHGDRAYTVSTYSERLVPYGSGPIQLVNGRLVLFFRRDPNGAWLVMLALNSHFKPIELIDRAEGT